MTAQTRTYLKGRFETNDIPTGTDYEDLIDSFVNLQATASQTLTGSLVVAGLDTTRVSAVVVSAEKVHVTNHIHHGYSSVTALGTSAGAAATYTTDITLIRVTDPAQRCIIGDEFINGLNLKVINDINSVTAAYVFPPAGATFIDQSLTTAANSPLLLVAGGTMELICVDSSSVSFIRY